MKYAALFFLLTMSAFAYPAEVDYWDGLEWDYSNATAYKIKINSNDIEFGLIGVTTQLYSYGDGRYEIIPKNLGISVNKLFSNEVVSMAVGLSYWADRNMIFTDNLNYELKFKYKHKNNIQLQFDHYGLTSITKSNAGLNKVSIFYTF